MQPVVCQGAPGPYTGLHLAAATTNTQQAGYRSNMGNGITLTGNDDQMYVGQLFRGLDFTDAAIVWSDNPGEFLADRLTFNFTSSYNAAATSGNTSFRGLRTLLIQPAGSGQEAFVGVGDFDAASATPSERLDILNGRLRIRELPLAANENANLAKYLVTDNNGVIHWRNVPGGGLSDASERMYVGLKCEAADRRSVLIIEPSVRFDVLNGPLLVERRCYDGVVT